MNRHFEDSRYYLRRATETAAKGLSEEIEAVEARLREVTGREGEPEPGRIEEIRAELGRLQDRAEGEERQRNDLDTVLPIVSDDGGGSVLDASEGPDTLTDEQYEIPDAIPAETFLEVGSSGDPAAARDRL